MDLFQYHFYGPITVTLLPTHLLVFCRESGANRLSWMVMLARASCIGLRFI